VRKTCRYRLLPTKAQETAMTGILSECRWLYNALLEERRSAWEERGESVGLYAQHALLPALKQARPSLIAAHSQVLQNVAVRLDLAFQAFFRRVKAGEKPGFPRFRGADRYDSFCYPQYGNGAKLQGDVLFLSKVGQVRVRLHRPLTGEIKTVCIRRQAGLWYACFAVECEPEPLCASGEAVGIDVGLSDFAFLSTGEAIANPRFYRKDERDMKRVQRRVSRAAKGSPARRKAKQALGKVHRRIANRRGDFTHQHSRRIINRFGTVCVEDIHVNRLVHNHCLAKSIMDAAWSQFFSSLTYKAECAGRRLVKVNPAYTSQDCHRCGHRQKMPLPARQFGCPCCGLSINRDHNASLNILAVGLHSLGLESVEAPAFTPGE
jgi:putative transposase